MSRRSVTNDRYRTERSGKTRKSASAAKPKRTAGEMGGSGPAKKTPAKPTGWRGLLGGGGAARPTMPRVEPTPEMKKLRMWWYVLFGVALVDLLAFTAIKDMNEQLRTALLGLYIVAITAVFYIEFGPLRKARVAAIEAAKKGGKGGKGGKPKSDEGKPAKPKDAEPKSDEPKPAGPKNGGSS